jgi:SAM-dependent methyltransferase
MEQLKMTENARPASAPATEVSTPPSSTATQVSSDGGDRRRPLWALLQSLDARAPFVKARLQRGAVRFGYRAVNRRMRSTGRECVNYGWAPTDDTAALPDVPQELEADRYSLLLYWRVAAPGNIAGKDVLEVGCGRGGGTTFLRSGLGARSVVGIDLTESSVKWCQQRWHDPSVTFRVGDAENMPLGDGSFDAVVNLESAHNYPEIDKFFGEAFRVLRPGGNFLMADMFLANIVDKVRDEIRATGFIIDEEEDISANVLKALHADAAARSGWVNENFPRLLRPALLEFTGTPGSGLFRGIEDGTVRYLRFAARKP